MAINIRKIGGMPAADAAVTNLQLLRLDLLKLKAGTVFHADASPAITVADSSTDPGTVALANAVKAAYNAHLASACSSTTGQGAHLAADATNPTVVADATDLASAETLLNDLKSKYNAHRVLTTSHPTADATNTVTSANATDSGTAITLVNELKAKINAHMAAAFAAQALVLVSL
jgi:hypothetical protein